MASLFRVIVAYNMPVSQFEQLGVEFPNIEFVLCDSDERLREQLPGATVLIGNTISPELLRQSPGLRWIQTTGAGVDRVLFPELIDSDVVVTNFSGVQASNMVEHILAMMLAFARGLPELIRRQMQGEWTRAPLVKGQRLPQSEFFGPRTFELGHQTLAVVGLGEVGKTLAVHANALGMRVIGMKRRASDPPAGIDRLFSIDELHTMLGEADHVAICLPLTTTTRHLFGAPEFRAMKPSAYIYNTGRGQIIDQDSLIGALQRGEISGAGLDVTSPEPLPPESPLWYMGSVLITCHTSGATPHHKDRSFAIVVENLRRYLEGRPLINVVDKREGY